MTPKKAAKIIGCTFRHVRALIQNRRLKAARKPMPGGGFAYDVSRREAIRYRDQPQPKGWPRGQARPKKTKGAKKDVDNKLA